MSMATNAFRPWKSGNEQVDIRKGNPNGVPFIVRAEKNMWRPINLLVFADSEEDAVKRVIDGLKDSIKVCVERGERENREESYNYLYVDRDIARYNSILELMEDPECVQVSRYNPEVIAKLNWDSRGL